MKTDHLELNYTKANDFINGNMAYVKNKNSGKNYILGHYRTMEQAKTLAPNAFKTLLAHSKGAFKEFCNE